MSVNNLPRVALGSGAAGIRTRDLLIASPAPYCNATKPQAPVQLQSKYIPYNLWYTWISRLNCDHSTVMILTIQATNTTTTLVSVLSVYFFLLRPVLRRYTEEERLLRDFFYRLEALHVPEAFPISRPAVPEH